MASSVPGGTEACMPYTIKRDLPDWFMKEVERYAY